MTDVLKDIHYMLAEIFIHYDGLGLSMYDYPEYKTLAEKYGFFCSSYEDAKRIQNENKR
jgi:hypothetical protein